MWLPLLLLVTLSLPVYAAENVTIGVLAKRGTERALEHKLGISRITTLKNRVLKRPAAEFSSVVFSRADHPPLKHRPRMSLWPP